MASDFYDHFVVFILDIKLWTGRKTLRPEDLFAGGIDPKSLPPESLASLGSKRIIGKEALAPFAALKREAEKTCLAVGSRFLGGYAVPNEKVDQVKEELNRIKINFQQKRQDFLEHYDQQIAAWITKHPLQWQEVIQKAVEPVGTVKRSLQFHYTPIAIATPDGFDEDLLHAQADGLFGQLCHEIRQQARTAYQTSYQGKTKVTRKALRPILAIRKKLAGLSFLNPSVAEAVQAIDDAMALIPDQGALEGTSLNLLSGLLGRQLGNFGRQHTADDQETDADDEDSLVMPTLPLLPAETVPSLAWDF